MLPLPEYSRFAISLFAILTPFAAVPAFLSLTDGLSAVERSRTAIVGAVTAALVLVIAALAGQIVLIALGTSLDALRVGGGLVLLLEALSMMKPREGRPRIAAMTSPSCGIVPLGLPLLAGPGSISTVIVEIHHGAGTYHALAVILCIVGICLTAWAILRMAQPIGERIGSCGLNVLSRLFGLMLAAIAVQIITAGLRDLFPVLA